MDANGMRERLTELREKKGISEYRMSLELGHANNYIRGITSGQSLPSMREFLNICEYLGVTERDFFDETARYPDLLRPIVERGRKLGEKNLRAILAVMECMTPEETEDSAGEPSEDSAPPAPE